VKLLWNLSGLKEVNNRKQSSHLIMAGSTSRYSSYNCLNSWDSYDKIPRYCSVWIYTNFQKSFCEKKSSAIFAWFYQCYSVFFSSKSSFAINEIIHIKFCEIFPIRKLQLIKDKKVLVKVFCARLLPNWNSLSIKISIRKSSLITTGSFDEYFCANVNFPFSSY
jgi:hypothetical protein